MPVNKRGLYHLSPEMWADTGRTIKALLVDDAAAYSWDVDDEFVSALTSSELTSVGYARAEVTSRTVSWDATNARYRYLSATLSFGPAAIGDDAAGVYLFEEVTDDTDSPLLTYELFNAPEATDGTDFLVTVTAEGLVRSAEV